MNYWQVSAGDGTTDIVDIFLKLNITLIGPGDSGDYFDNRDEYEGIGVDGDLVRRFAEEVQVGDVFVLKHIKHPHDKTWNIIAVGKVISPYRYETIFNKVDDDEWNMQHCRRVKWYIPKEEVVVTKGGAPIRIQKMKEDNPMKIKAEELLRKLEDTE